MNVKGSADCTGQQALSVQFPSAIFKFLRFALICIIKQYYFTANEALPLTINPTSLTCPSAATELL